MSYVIITCFVVDLYLYMCAYVNSPDLALLMEQEFLQEQQDEVGSESIKETIEQNVDDWAKFLDSFMTTLNQKHYSANQTGLQGQHNTVYGGTAILAQHHLKEANTSELSIVYKHLVKGLTNTNYLGNRRIGVNERPSVLWEKFAKHYLKWVYGREYTTHHCGGKGDYGVDIQIKKDDAIHAVVQVKRGNFFKRGKGPQIVRELFGSMGFYNIKNGIIFTNESTNTVATEKVNEHISTYRSRKFEITVICVEDIEYIPYIIPNEDASKFKNFITTFIQEDILKTITETVKNVEQRRWKSQQLPDRQRHDMPYPISQ